MDKLAGTGYFIFIELRPWLLRENGDVNLIISAVSDRFRNWLTDQGMPSTYEVLYTVSASVIDRILAKREVDNGTLEYALVSFMFEFVKTTDIQVFDNILAIDGTNVTVNISDNEELLFQAKINHWFVTPKTPLHTITNEMFIPYIYEDSSYIDDVNLDSFEKLTKFQTCPYIILLMDKDFISIKEDAVYIGKYNYSVEFEDIYIDNNTAYICSDTIQKIFDEFPDTGVSRLNSTTENSENNSSEAIQILSFICVIISIVFSFFTFITYVFFKELRTQPGVNNMLLAASLIISQCLFLFGFNQAPNVSAAGCTALGVLIHYSWTVFLVWMSICTFHMFRVFSKNQTSAAKFNILKTTLIYTVSCVILSCIPVCLNIIIWSVENTGSGIGYGGSYCYLTQSDFYIYILSIPLALIVATNITLYVVVVVHIERTRSKIQSSSSGDNSLFSAYIKMSTITGATWIFGFIFMFTEQTWAEYLFVLLNASQGLFIFLAFMVNRKVLELYRELLLKKKKKTNTFFMSLSSRSSPKPATTRITQLQVQEADLSTTDREQE